MKILTSKRFYLCASAFALAAISLMAVIGNRPVSADRNFFLPGNLVLSRSVYDNQSSNVMVGMSLPPNCVATSGSCSPAVTATSDGTYPFVFNNVLVDASFGITSKILLDQIATDGTLINTLEVPNSSQPGVPSTKDQMVTSFPSKSEIALNLSTDRNVLTFMGYHAPVDALDISNSNTAFAVDPTNPVGLNAHRVVASVDAHGKFRFTLTQAYSGNNGRAAILNNSNGANVVYMSGNAGNGGNPQPNGILVGGGAQILTPVIDAEVDQAPGTPAPLGSFNITQLPPNKADKIGKDNNFRGLTIFNNVVYFTKGSGGNGINTVYFVDTTTSGGASGVCNDTHGVGLPAAGASLPTSPLAYDPALLSTNGLDPNNMCILKGFPTALKSTTSFPFGIWFADANTLYVADEGDGYAGGADLYLHAAAQGTAGLQKWIFNAGAGMWIKAYTLQSGLGLGSQYSATGYPTGLNLATCVVAKTTPAQPNPNNCPISKSLLAEFSAPDGLPWAPATAGLRNITGRVNGDGTVTIWAITSTVSGGGDTGADPNKLVAITDQLAATALPSGESFTEVRAAGFGEVLRGISFTPGTPFP